MTKKEKNIFSEYERKLQRRTQSMAAKKLKKNKRKEVKQKSVIKLKRMQIYTKPQKSHKFIKIKTNKKL